MASTISGDKRAAAELVDLARATPSLVLRRRIQSVWIVRGIRSPVCDCHRQVCARVPLGMLNFSHG